MAIVLAIFGLPRFLPPGTRLIVMSLAGAGGVTAMVCFFRDRFRGRTGSLKPAIALAAVLWGCAAFTIVITLRGLVK